MREMLADRGSRVGCPSGLAVVKREREDMKLQAAAVWPRVEREVIKEEPPAVAACRVTHLSPESFEIRNYIEIILYVVFCEDHVWVLEVDKRTA